MVSKAKKPNYTLGEELVNAISHGVGAGLAIAALVLCVCKASTAAGVVASALYGFFMIVLYTISCIYHALSPNLRGKRVLQVIDHANVFLFEAGTYMPICLSLLSGEWTWLGWLIFGSVWAVTVVAVVLSSINIEKFTWVGVACNLILGWGALLILPVLLQLTGWNGVFWLVMGGVMYSVGAGLYVLGAKKKWIHSVFHFFVIAGTVCQFVFIYGFCL